MRSDVKMFGIMAYSVELGEGVPQWRDIGVCGLTKIDNINQNAEFSLYVAPEYQGRGSAKQAFRPVPNAPFLKMNATEIKFYSS